MSEAVSSNHDPDSKLPEPIRTEEIAVEQEDLILQQPDPVGSGENLQGAIAGWQAVKFPDAVSLAELSHPLPSASEAIDLRALNPKDNQSDLTNLIHQLQQENLAFRAQVDQLECDLAQAQVELQLEVTRFYCKESEKVAIAAQEPFNNNELNCIPQQISQLSQALDASQQMGQRQQILVETLSEQLESSQERIAHLERDCAITQQRYNEQVQLVLQAENICRDLRMRLHRQQRQALQFKAALEKSLEMGTVQGVAIAHSDLASSSATDATPFIPKVQPVQPWSQVAEAGSRGYVNCRSDENVLPNLFSKLWIADQQSAEEVEVTPIQEVELPSIQAPAMANEGEQSVVEVASVSEPQVETISTLPEVITPEGVSQYMGLIFPKQADSQSPAAPDSQEEVFDLSPFLEAGEAGLATAPVVKLQPIAKQVLPPLLRPPRLRQPSAHQQPSVEETASQPSQRLGELGDREDTLWADLAKLIEPDLLVDEPASMSDLSNQAVGQSSASATANPFQPAANLMSDNEPVKESNNDDRPSTTKPLSLDFFAYIEKKATNTQDIAALHSAPKDESKAANASPSRFQKETAESVEVPSSEISLPKTIDDLPNSCPSPILYPFRPSKKLKSMSAVDLPSFRHAAN